MRFFLPVLAAAFMLTGCSDAPKPVEKAKEAEKPAEPVTGRYALYQMYQVARGWAPDIQIIQLNNIPITEVKSTESKYGAWQATFVSPSQGKAKTYTYAVVEVGPTLHKGVFAGLDESYSGQRGQSKPFLIAAAKIDTDAAWEAAKKESEAYLKKNPNRPVNYQLEWTNRYPDPAWRVIFGESVSTSDYSVYVDSVTGNFLGKAH